MTFFGPNIDVAFWAMLKMGAMDVNNILVHFSLQENSVRIDTSELTDSV